MKIKFLILAVGLLSATACYKTNITNGPTTGIVSPNADGMWYHGLINLVDLKGPVNLKKVCPSGQWTKINVKTSFLNGLVSAFVPFYSPQSVTVYCANGSAINTLINKDNMVVKVLPPTPKSTL